MTRFALLTAVLLGLCAPALAAGDGARGEESVYERVMRTGTIRCGFIPWPPGFEIDPNTGAVKGPSKTLFESIIRLTGWDVEFVEVSLTNEILDLNNGKIDAMCSSGPWTITNVKFVDYTTPAVYSPILVYVRADESRFSSYKDLDSEEASLVGIDGDVSIDLARHRFPRAKIRSLINLTDPAMLMREVADGKADTVILDPVTAESFMTNNPGLMKQLPVQEPLAVYPVGMAVKWGEYALAQTLNRATEMAINIGLADDLIDLYDPDRHIMYSPGRPYILPE